MLHREPFGHKGHIAALLFALVTAVFLTSCGSDSAPESSGDAVPTEGFETGEGARLPLVIDGDRLGISSLDGNPPTPLSDPGYVDGVAYDAEGALVYVQRSGQEPGFYRVEDGVPRLIIPLPWNDPGLPAKWSPDVSRAAWIESDGETSELVLAQPGEEPRRVKVGEITNFLWSPESRQILAWEGWHRPDTYIVNVESGDVEALALKAVPVDWTPSGDLLVWEETSETGSGRRTVALVRPDGSERRVLGSIAIPNDGPRPVSALSPDGRWLAWDNAVSEEGERSSLAVAASDGSAVAWPRCAQPCQKDWIWSHPSWSPDGQRLAWSQDGHILVAETGVWEGRVVAEGEAPIWSPDGSKIAYTRIQDNTFSLYTVSLEDGSEAKVASYENVLVLLNDIVWSPDGRQLAVPIPTSEKSDLFSFDVQSGDLQRLPIAVEYAPSGFLAPDGSAVVLYTEDGWTVYGLDGTSRTIRKNASDDMCTDWSPDASRSLCAGRSGLYTLETSTNDVEWLLKRSAESARWSPDESAVAFAQNHQGKHRLSVLNTATGEVQELATDLQENVTTYYYGSGSYAWSPDGKWIAFTDWRPEDTVPYYDGASSIFVIGDDGENLRQIADSPGSKRDLVFSPDGRYLAYGEPTGLVAVNVATGEETTVASTAWEAPIWVDPSSLLVHDPRGISIVGLDGSVQVIVARVRGCGQQLIGWSEGKLFFSNSCSHDRY
jgi:Tol biopolymer transport system component